MEWRNLVFLMACCWSHLSTAADYAATITNGSEKTAEVCWALGKKLPQTMQGIRQLGKLVAEKVEPDTIYCERGAECTIHTLDFEGLNLQVLSERKTRKIWLMMIDIASPRWRLMEQTQIGQSIQNLGRHYGEPFPTDKSPILLSQSCTPMTIYQHDGTVTRLILDCQACH